MQNINLNFNVPIKEFNTNPINADFIIDGVAINATTTSNNHKFLSEELEKSSHTLTGVPLLKDHDNSIDSIVGKVVGSSFDIENGFVGFKAIVNDAKARELIERGDLNTVSVGAMVTDVDEEDGVIIPRGIIFKELSLVAVPADPNATFIKVFQEAYSHSSKDDSIELKGGINMEEANIKDRLDSFESKVEAQVEGLKTLMAEAIDKLTKVKEADADEVKVEEPVAEPEPAKEPEPKVEEPEEEVKADEPEEEDAEEEEEEVEERYNIVESKGFGKANFTVVR